jgi:hypothetical protein
MMFAEPSHFMASVYLQQMWNFNFGAYGFLGSSWSGDTDEVKFVRERIDFAASAEKKK